MVLFAEVVLVEEFSSVRDNADKKSLASWSLNFFLFQWCMASTSFQLGNLPGISSEKVSTGVRKESGEVIVHCSVIGVLSTVW